jgi:hypothetical protein
MANGFRESGQGSQGGQTEPVDSNQKCRKQGIVRKTESEKPDFISFLIVLEELIQGPIHARHEQREPFLLFSRSRDGYSLNNHPVRLAGELIVFVSEVALAGIAAKIKLVHFSGFLPALNMTQQNQGTFAARAFRCLIFEQHSHDPRKGLKFQWNYLSV